MARNLKPLRHRAFVAQDGRCFYCSQPIWEDGREAFAKAHGMLPRLATHLRSTAEHLVARQDAGKNSQQNIVAACVWCNSRRHLGRAERAPDCHAYQHWVQAQVSAGKWHPVAASQAAASRARKPQAPPPGLH